MKLNIFILSVLLLAGLALALPAQEEGEYVFKGINKNNVFTELISNKADLTHADLSNADVQGTMFDGAKISEAIGLANSQEMLMK